MGGIVGKLSFDRDVQISPGTVQRMLHVLGRGAPGGECGTSSGPGFALGSCADPRAGAPVGRNESGTVHVVADCDLVHTGALRSLLEDRGHDLRSRSEAELIAHAYEEWGDACVERLVGPFACAIWDSLKRRLLLARDRFGVRPLCFAVLDGEGIVFASELGAIVTDPAVGRELYGPALDAYLALGYVPAPLTMSRRVSKLEPAHTLRVEGRSATLHSYWDPREAEAHAASERDVLARLESCLRTSASAAFKDGEAFLLASGGIGSTALAAVTPAGATTVSVGIDSDVAELDRVASMAAHLGLRCETDVAWVEGAHLAPVLATAFDEPASDPGAIAQYAVFVAARRYGPVAATGHGAWAFWNGTPPAPLFDEPLRHAIYTRRFSREIAEADGSQNRHATARGWLADSQLAIAGRLAAAADVRLLHPYLDRDLAEIALAIPAELKQRGGTRMYALQQVASRHIPSALLGGHASRYPTPAWLSRALAALVPDVLLGESFESRGILSRQALRVLWDEHRTGQCDHARRFWSLLMLELWLREFTDDDAAAQPPVGVLVRAA